MNIVRKEVKSTVKIKSTSFLSLPVELENDPVARAERRLKAFMANSDWIYETLLLLDKALENETELNNLDQWALERLDLTARVEYGQLILIDRYYTRFTNPMLISLKAKIISLATAYASKLIRKPDLHHMEKMFVKSLRKSTRKLTDQEINVLKEAYLKVQNGKIVNLKGQEVGLPKFNFLRLLIA
jgi:hypothetical protein